MVACLMPLNNAMTIVVPISDQLDVDLWRERTTLVFVQAASSKVFYTKDSLQYVESLCVQTTSMYHGLPNKTLFDG